MWDVATQTTPVARKEYACDGMRVISDNCYGREDFTDDEWKTIEAVRREGNKISPGMRYIKVSGIYDGEWQTFRARTDIDEILVANDMYADE